MKIYCIICIPKQVCWWVALAGRQERLRSGESPNPRLKWVQSESELSFGAVTKHYVVASVQENPQPPWLAPWRGISKSEGGGTSATTTSPCMCGNYTELICHLPFTRFCVYNIVVFSCGSLVGLTTNRFLRTMNVVPHDARNLCLHEHHICSIIDGKSLWCKEHGVKYPIQGSCLRLHGYSMIPSLGL